ncbi:MAG: riboflavin synthase [Planctomycetota bacterium]|jgi:riboflavin synthase
MFTGLIKKLCVVKYTRQISGGLKLRVDLGPLVESVEVGDSISINGACLTVSKLDRNLANFDVSGETLEKTTIGELRSGSDVNVELSLSSADRFGGHMVQGHVDGVGEVKSIQKKGRFWDMGFAASNELLSEMVVKGSVAVDGISLTVVDINDNSFSVSLIPETLERTTLGRAKVGQKVNIETDMIVKTIKRQLEQMLGKKEKLTLENLQEMGY